MESSELEKGYKQLKEKYGRLLELVIEILAVAQDIEEFIDSEVEDGDNKINS